MRVFSWLVSFILLLAVVAFAIGNRDMATLSFWPFDLQATMPLAFLVLGILFLGIFIGGFFVFLGSLRCRIEACRLRREIESLRIKLAEKQVDSLAVHAVLEKCSPLRRLFSLKFNCKKP